MVISGGRSSYQAGGRADIAGHSKVRRRDGMEPLRDAASAKANARRKGRALKAGSGAGDAPYRSIT